MSPNSFLADKKTQYQVIVYNWQYSILIINLSAEIQWLEDESQEHEAIILFTGIHWTQC